MRDFLDEQWRPLLEANGLAGFDPLWDLQAEWFEEPNQRRGGWSGVARVELERSDGGREAVFLKRQENHTRRTLRHPFRGEPTFEGEMRNIQALQRAGVPSLEPVYYGQRKVKGVWRAILVTRELKGFEPLNQWMRDWLEAGWANSVQQRRALIPEVSTVVRRLHDHRLVHNALHPKHLFIRFPEEGRPEVRLIDLEKMRFAPSPRRAAQRDLDSLNRRARHWSTADRLRFLKGYLGVSRLDSEGRGLWRYLAERKIRFVSERGERG